MRYDRVVASRLELLWLSPHPPLEVLGSECAWVPSGEDCKAHLRRSSNPTPKLTNKPSSARVRVCLHERAPEGESDSSIQTLPCAHIRRRRQ